MSSLPCGELPRFQPRRFLPATNWKVANWSEVAPFFDRLEARVPQCSTTAALEEWLLDWDELTAALSEEWARRHISMTAHTDDPQARRAYLVFIEHILPQVQPRQFQLTHLFRSHPLRPALPKRLYEVNDRHAAAVIALFRQENVALETEEAKLSQDYDEIAGAMTVRFRGEERTRQVMWKFQQEPNRLTRQEAWELDNNRSLVDADKLDHLFESMFQRRNQMASNAGLADYRDYAWRRLRRFDYTPAQCLEFHSAIENEILPVVCELQNQRWKTLGVATLRPWDMDVDPAGHPPLRPFTDIPKLLAGTQRIFGRIDGELAGGFQRLQDLRLLDLNNRQNKAPGAYQAPLSESRASFIFLNTVGVHMDVLTLLHESGHAFHTQASRTQPLLGYRTSIPIEFCEVASISMELIGSEHLDEFYSPADVRRARRAHFEAILASFPWMATIDAFQHWMYTHPGHTLAERADTWLGLMRRFGGLVDWTGHERIQANLWHDVGHIFQCPLYFVEYGIACLGALQVWSKWKRDRTGALAAYKRALALGGSRPLPELFAAAGCRFEFTAKTIRPLVQLIRDELTNLST